MSSEFIQRQNIKLGIAGAKQAENASLAIQLYRMWEQLRATGKDVTDCIPTACSSVKEIPQLEVSELDDAILKGLSSCVWPGRAQTINRGDVTYYLDGAHTKESMEVCVQWFEEAAKKEMNHQRGKKFARILLFNATSDRDVGTLLTCLTGCNFDAAVFCTNLLSTMESLNRADQLNKTVTQGFMMEKVDKSKSTWDELIAKSRRDSDVARNSNLYSGNRPLKLCDKTNRIDSRALLDYNFNRAHTGVTKEATHTAEIPHELKRSPVKHFKVPHDTFAESKSDLVCQSTSWVRHISAADQENVLKEKENKNMPIETGKNYAVVQVKCCSGGEQISKPLLNGFHSNHVSSIGCIDSSLSMKFSCILHALTWATQGRDLLLTLNDPDFIVPFTPNELRQADHLQILVTGSLLLVGGVLGVVDPHMND